MKLVSPRAAALRILATRAEVATLPLESIYPLADFQREGAARAAAILEQRNGVIIADGVGLGKTFIAAALIEQALQAGPVGVAVPAALRPMWRRALRDLPQRDAVHLVSHGQLSRGHVPVVAPRLVVVDEAHAFRNPATQRYRALRAWCVSARAVLLTATPVNNSLSDLYFQIRLFAPDDAFRDLGIASLDALLRCADPDVRALERLRAAVMIRRTRADVRDRQREIALPSGERLRFPGQVNLSTVTHAPFIPVELAEQLLEAVRFAAYPDDTTRTLLGISLLKRIQSGRFAARETIRRMIGFHHRFLRALDDGRLLQSHPIRGSEEQLFFSELLLPAVPRTVNAHSLRRDVLRDVALLERFCGLIDSRPDPKLPALIRLLTARAPPARTLVFSEFRDTALFLWRALQTQFRIGLITGSASFLGAERASRIEVIRHFAPLANAAPEPHRSARVDVLIATDVLAEGLNLQDADAVVSYDLPWNPVRLIQRAGRVDRIGSPHDVVTVFNFLPDRELDRTLGIVRRLRTKLHSLRSAVGNEAAVLEPEEASEAYFGRLAAGDPALLSDHEPGPPLLHGVDLAGAAPPGCIAATSPGAGRVLACFRSQNRIREVIWDGLACMADSAEADRIVRGALGHAEICSASLAMRAVTICQEHLEAERRIPGSDPDAAALARLIQYAVLELGLAATPDLISAADAILPSLGRCSDPKWAQRQILAARSSEQLRAAFDAIALKCRLPTQEPLLWELVAAIAAD
ncbi:MAG TPA: DEAD/DEAH box helicase [Longimicrobiales bacterium]